MSVVDTLSQLYKLSELSKQNTGEKIIEIHRDLLCNPLEKYFPKVSMEELHFELLGNGMFDPHEGVELDELIKGLELRNVWATLQEEFERLMALWKGPDIPIYIYPLTKYRPKIEGVEVKKSGVSYGNVLFLFLTAELDANELKALLAHEYHHICRLVYLNKASLDLRLIDSIIIEGLAEWAVEELYGVESLSPWTKSYKFEDVAELWKEKFVPFITLNDTRNHFPFLYGDESIGLPRWIGYSLGYLIVQSYVKKCGPFSQQELYKIPSDEILKGSQFNIKG